MVFQRAARAVDQEKARGVSLERRRLSDRFGRQFVLEVVDVHDLGVYTDGSGVVLPDVALEPGKNGAEERVLDEPAEDLERARLRVAERTRDVGDRRHFLARTVLEDLGGHPDRSLVDLLDELLVAVLFLVIDLHVPEARLHPPTHPPVLAVYLAQ